MAPSDFLGETWPGLCARIGAEQRHEWALKEPALAPFTDLHTLALDVQASKDHAHVDEVFAALLRLAAADNGDDQDAGLVVAHLMHRGSRGVAAGLRDLSPEIDAIVAAELWVQIRSYRWQHRRHSHALGLKRDTRAAVLRDLCPARDRDGRRRLVLQAPEVLTWLMDARADGTSVESGGVPGAAASDVEDELLDVLAWAEGNGVLTEDDVRLLLEFELASMPERYAAAAQWGLTERGMRRRCTKAKARLHNARMAYLEHAA